MSRIPPRPSRRPPPAKTEEVFNILRERAAKGEPMNYGAIAKQVGLANMGVAYPLGYIAGQCEKRSLPLLNVIAVNKATGRPGHGCPAFPGTWENMRDQVFARDWSSVEFDDLTG